MLRIAVFVFCAGCGEAAVLADQPGDAAVPAEAGAAADADAGVLPEAGVAADAAVLAEAGVPLPEAGVVEDAAVPDPGEPDTSQLGDHPYFRTGAELCEYVNASRMASSGHDRYRGGNNAGYHTTRTWPLTFTVDAALMTEARTEAQRLEAGGAPPGRSFGDGFRYRRLSAGGINTTAYQVTALDEPGDWNASYFKSGLINASAAARQYLYYHDPGGDGPVLRNIGCAGANAGNGAVWWVVMLRD